MTRLASDWLATGSRNIVAGLTLAFEYLDKRVTGACQACYNSKEMFEFPRLARMFDPERATQLHVKNRWLDELEVAAN